MKRQSKVLFLQDIILAKYYSAKLLQNQGGGCMVVHCIIFQTLLDVV